MRKKLWVLAFVLLCAVWLGMVAMADAPLIPRPEDISAAEAEAIARDVMRKNSGLTDAEMEAFFCHVCDLWPNGSAEDESRYWLVAFTVGEDGLEFYVELDSQSAKIRTWGPEDFGQVYRGKKEREEMTALAEQAKAEWEKEKGPWEFWSYQDKAIFYQQNPGWLLRDMPEEGDMPEAEAIARARAALMEMLLADEAYLDSFRLDIGFRKQWQWGEGLARCWIIAFRPPEPMEDGGYALTHQVTVNAETGEVDASVFNLDGSAVDGRYYRDTMYYNPDGGRFFHHDADCLSVSEKYKPLKAYGRGDILAGERLQYLLPCRHCASCVEGE